MHEMWPANQWKVLSQAIALQKPIESSCLQDIKTCHQPDVENNSSPCFLSFLSIYFCLVILHLHNHNFAQTMNSSITKIN